MFLFIVQGEPSQLCRERQNTQCRWKDGEHLKAAKSNRVLRREGRKDIERESRLVLPAYETGSFFLFLLLFFEAKLQLRKGRLDGFR